MTKSTTPTPATTPADKTAKRVGTNSRTLPFTQDRSGIRQEFRRGGVRAIGRLMGDDARLADFITDAEVLVDYARARVAEQKAEIAAKQKAQRDAIAAERAIRITREKEELKRRKEAVKSAEAAVTALEASIKGE